MAPLFRVLQTNFNYARQTQDLFLQSLTKRGCCLGIAAEPYIILSTVIAERSIL